MNSFGDTIRSARKNQKISLRALAQTLGVNFTYLSKIENGELAAPAEDKVIALAGALNLDADELFRLANRVPSDLTEPVLRSQMPKILRATKDLSNEQLDELLQWVNEQTDTLRDKE